MQYYNFHQYRYFHPSNSFLVSKLPVLSRTSPIQKQRNLISYCWVDIQWREARDQQLLHKVPHTAKSQTQNTTFGALSALVANSRCHRVKVTRMIVKSYAEFDERDGGNTSEFLTNVERFWNCFSPSEEDKRKFIRHDSTKLNVYTLALCWKMPLPLNKNIFLIV